MTIEQRITAALNNRAAKSDALAELIVETEAAIAAAEKGAEAERAKALDPMRSPDPAQARQAMEDAEFAVQRLRSVLPRLQQRHQQVAGAELYAEWGQQFDALIPRHKAAAERLRTIYQKVEAELIPALVEARAVDAEVRRVANAKPYHLAQSNNDGRKLPTVECAARGLRGVIPEFSLLQIKLPAFDKPNQLAWPPYELPLAVQVAASMVPVASDPRSFTGDWWQVQQERAQAAREQQQRAQQEQQAEALKNYRGPKWWEGEKPDPERAA
jgi:hypothetical protein